MIVDNTSQSWIYVDDSGRFAEPGTTGKVLALDPPTDRAKAEWKAPPSVTQPVATTSEQCTLTFTDALLSPTTGYSSRGARAPYEDRNPITSIFYAYEIIAAPEAATIWEQYTCPANRRAHVTVGELVTESLGGYSATQVYIETNIQYYINGPNAYYFWKDAFLYVENAAKTRADLEAGSDLFISAGDRIALITFDGGAGGTSLHHGTFTVLEFDA